MNLLSDPFVWLAVGYLALVAVWVKKCDHGTCCKKSNSTPPGDE